MRKDLLFLIFLVLLAIQMNAQNPKNVYDINEVPVGSSPNSFTVFNNKLYFEAGNCEYGANLWGYDGTNEPEIAQFINAHNILVYNNKLLFSASGNDLGNELWMWDGVNNPEMVMDIFPGNFSSNPEKLIVFNNKLFFRANDGTHGTELWVYDGINEPEIVMDIYPGNQTSSPSYSTILNITHVNFNQSVNTSIELYDMLGKRVLRMFVTNKEIYTGNVNKGLYIYRFNYNNKT